MARFGDNSSVIFLRQGLQSYPMIKHRNIDSIQGAGEVAREWADWEADAVFIDATGGFGAGWIDQLRALGRSSIAVAFSGQAHDSVRYFNKRAEMYFDAINWIRRGGALPESPELAAALTQTTYSFQGDRFLLEPKEDVKAKLGYSCDEADAFVLTFAEPVAARTSRRFRSRSAMPPDYDPFAEMTATWQTTEQEYDPFR